MKQNIWLYTALVIMVVIAAADYSIVSRPKTIIGVSTERMILTFKPKPSTMVITRNIETEDGITNSLTAPMTTHLNSQQTLALGALTPKQLGGTEDTSLTDLIDKAVRIGLSQNGYSVTGGVLYTTP